ncbi:cytidylate kinase family protein [Candidatus Pacearchaeota archaeon]|nr:cytidylate kinase family protein [Candidatus Pacearchaeota archaeon]
MIITISGMPGSGKNTVADILAKKLKLKRYSVGNYRRGMAKKHGMTLQELNKLGEKQGFTDKEADEWQKRIGKKQGNFIIDGRLSWHFISNSIKIFLDVKPEIGAKRIMLDNRQEETAKTNRQAIKMWKTRVASDIKRYKKYYNLNPYSKKNYDFVLDTSSLNIKEAAGKVLEFIKACKK